MKFSEQLEARYAEMITHYPVKRSLLVPFLLYSQDEYGYITDAVIEELARRLEITELDIRDVISYYSMLRTKPGGKYNVQVCTNICCLLRGRRTDAGARARQTWRRSQPGSHSRRRLLGGRGRMHRRLLLGAGHAGQLRLP